MRFVVNLLGGLLPVGWLGVAADYFNGARTARKLEDQPPYPPDTAAPALSIVFAACNEEAKLPAAFPRMLAQQYPGPLEIVAVDDRSSDRTPEILDTLAAQALAGTRVVVLHVRHLPPGWLGKTHALYQGAQNASGAWILFTDADMQFAPDALSRAVRFAEREGLDHLVAFFGLVLHGFWENAFGLCFSLMFFLRYRPWHVRNPKRPEYLGAGGFNLIRRTAYERIGTHRAIALEVADDVELGHKVKLAGLRSEVIGASELVRVRWQEGGVFGLMDGLTKNAYAGLDYSPWVLFRSVALLLVTVVWPPIGMLVSRSRRQRRAHALSAAILATIGIYHAKNGSIPPLYGLTLPLSTLLLIAVMFRSTYVTEKNGGITWRGTFYPLDELRARPIPPTPPRIMDSVSG